MISAMNFEKQALMVTTKPENNEICIQSQNLKNLYQFNHLENYWYFFIFSTIELILIKITRVSGTYQLLVTQSFKVETMHKILKDYQWYIENTGVGKPIENLVYSFIL